MCLLSPPLAVVLISKTSTWNEEHQELRKFWNSGLESSDYYWVMDYLAVQGYQSSYDFAVQKPRQQRWFKDFTLFSVYSSSLQPFQAACSVQLC